jgi:gentisate 1,2-dioxygenase
MDGSASGTQTGAQSDARTGGEDPYFARARYYSPSNIFQVKRAAIPRRNFIAECERARADDTPTGWITLDIAGEIGVEAPATTPLMLARYAKVAPGETLDGRFVASGEIYYVISGCGTATKAAETLTFAESDVFTLPGGGATTLRAGGGGAVLFQATNEPELAFHGLAAPEPANSPTVAARYPMESWLAELTSARDANNRDENRSGQALHLTSERKGKTDSLHPTIKVAINSLDPGCRQRQHRHNSVAMTLPLQSKGVYSVIEGERLDWHPFAMMITPPTELHEHCNEGNELMLSLVIQDGGLYFRCRTIGFSFD